MQLGQEIHFLLLMYQGVDELSPPSKKKMKRITKPAKNKITVTKYINTVSELITNTALNPQDTYSL